LRDPSPPQLYIYSRYLRRHLRIPFHVTIQVKRSCFRNGYASSPSFIAHKNLVSSIVSYRTSCLLPSITGFTAGRSPHFADKNFGYKDQVSMCTFRHSTNTAKTHRNTMLSLAFLVSSLVTLSLVSPAKADTPCGYAVGINAATWNQPTPFTLVAVYRSNSQSQQLVLGPDNLASGNTAWIGVISMHLSVTTVLMPRIRCRQRPNTPLSQRPSPCQTAGSPLSRQTAA
jgi:hypothetical protein